ncbi:MAG: FkbM family methyltransferase, partial [Burkholderiales bacterium]
MIQADHGRFLASDSRASRSSSKIRLRRTPRQVRTFAPEGDETILAETLRGWLEYYGNDAPIGRALTQYGEWAEAELSVLRVLCRPGQTVVDVGAHVGNHTLAFARVVGPHGSVLAFEPQRAIFNLLQRNMDANGCTMVKLYQAGVGAAEGQMKTPPIDYGAHANFGAVALKPKDSDEGDLVRILTLDSLDLDRCDLLKIDAEGMGIDVLAGARGVIDRLAPIIAIECNGVGEGVAAFQALSRSGYRAWLLRA